MMRFRVYSNNWYYGKLYISNYGHYFIPRSCKQVITSEIPGYGGSVPIVHDLKNLKLLRVQ